MEKYCKNCGKPFEPKSAKATYCSDLCRVKAFRQAKKIPENKVVEKAIAVETEEAWITMIRDYCLQAEIIPQDLIKAHLKSLEKPKESIRTPNEPKEKTPSGETYLQKRQREKLGIK